jgi:hypothetical protein
MGKFNAAKMSGGADVAFQNNYNYLIDLLDNGYLAEGIVGGKRVRVDVNPRDGFKMNIDNTDVFYIDSTGDAVFTGKVTIGSNSEFEEGYNPITLSDDAKDSLAQSMGYDDYADMVAEATAGNTIIDGGYLNTVLVEAHSIVAEKLLVGSGNLITDVDSFEQFAVGAFGGAQIVSTTNIVTESAAYHGKKSVALQTVTAETLYDLWFNPNGTDAGFIKLPFTGRYLLSGYVKSESGYSQTCVIEPILRAGATSSASTSGTCTAASLNMTYEMGWRRITATIDLTSVADDPYLTFRVMVESLGANQWTYWDCFQLEYIGTRVDASASVFSPGGSTTINGNNITTGKIQSEDTKTYFDLDNDEIMMDGGVNGSVKINPTVGLQLLDESDVFVGGIANVGGVLGLIAQKIAGTADPTVWGQIGAITGGGLGLELVDKTGGVFFIAARLVDGGFTLLDHSEVNRFYADATSTQLFDAAGVVRFFADAALTQLYDAAFVGRFYADATATRLYDADGYERLTLSGTSNYSTMKASNGASYNEIGVDGTGAYKITAGTKTYL